MLDWKMITWIGIVWLAAWPVQAAIQDPDRQRVSRPSTRDAYAGEPGCLNCNRGEAALLVVDQVPSGGYAYTPNPTCQTPLNFTHELKTVASAASSAIDGNYWGALKDLNNFIGIQVVRDQYARGTIGRWLNGSNNAQGYCKPICAILPQGARYTGGWRLGAREYLQNKPFTIDHFEGQSTAFAAEKSNSSIGWFRWVNGPTKENRTICAGAMNWSNDRTREMLLEVHFIPPRGWHPPSGAVTVIPHRRR